MAKRKTKQESWAEQEERWKAERAEREAADRAKKNKGSEVSKALYRLLEITEVLVEAGDTLPAKMTIEDQFGNEQVVDLTEIKDLLGVVVNEMDPQQNIKDGTTSRWDELKDAEEQRDRLQDVALGLASYLPLDEFRLTDIRNMINKSSCDLDHYIELLPLYMDCPTTMH